MQCVSKKCLNVSKDVVQEDRPGQTRSSESSEPVRMGLVVRLEGWIASKACRD